MELIKGQKFKYIGDDYGTQYYELTDTKPVEQYTYFDTAKFYKCNHVCIGKTKETSFTREVMLSEDKIKSLPEFKLWYTVEELNNFKNRTND